MITRAVAQDIPKVSLHCHLLGAVPAATAVELAARAGVRFPGDPNAATVYDSAAYADLGEFMSIYDLIGTSLRTRDDYRRITYESLTDFGAHHNVWYREIFVTPQPSPLEVLGTDQHWHDVSPIEGALLVNLGDLTAHITNDYWMSTLHRVKPPVADGAIKRRRSAAFFHDGNVDAVISTAPGYLDSDAGLAYEPVTVGDHIAKLAGSRQGKSNVAAVREAARVLAATPFEHS